MSDLNVDELKEGTAIVDLKFNEVFSFKRSVDGPTMEQRLDKFRLATPEEEEKLRVSGNSYAPLD